MQLQNKFIHINACVISLNYEKLRTHAYLTTMQLDWLLTLLRL